MTNEKPVPEQYIDLTRGYGKAIFGVSLLLAFAASLTVLFIYVSFLSWAASGILYYSELLVCVLSTLGLLLGLIFFWSSRALFNYITLASSAMMVLLGATVLLSTLNRDRGSTSSSNIMFVALPITLSFMASALSYLKSRQLTAKSR